MSEKTSNKISKIMDLETTVYYQATCGCGNSECGLTIELEYDPEMNDVSLTMYQTLTYCTWFGIMTFDKLYWFKDMYRRIGGALKLLFTGRIRLEESFLLRDTEQMDAFITAIQEGREKVKDGSEKQGK